MSPEVFGRLPCKKNVADDLNDSLQLWVNMLLYDTNKLYQFSASWHNLFGWQELLGSSSTIVPCIHERGRNWSTYKWEKTNFLLNVSLYLIS